MIDISVSSMMVKAAVPNLSLKEPSQTALTVSDARACTIGLKNKNLETYFIHATRKPPIYACWVGQTAPFATAHCCTALFETVMLKGGQTMEGVSRASGAFFSQWCLKKWCRCLCVQWMALVASSLLRLTITRVLVSHSSRHVRCCFVGCTGELGRRSWSAASIRGASWYRTVMMMELSTYNRA
jgi:hypothetical protein